jgi:hypothetical protein
MQGTLLTILLILFVLPMQGQYGEFGTELRHGVIRSGFILTRRKGSALAGRSTGQAVGKEASLLADIFELDMQEQRTGGALGATKTARVKHLLTFSWLIQEGHDIAWDLSQVPTTRYGFHVFNKTAVRSLQYLYRCQV